jgi:hypothetical protein
VSNSHASQESQEWSPIKVDNLSPTHLNLPLSVAVTLLGLAMLYFGLRAPGSKSQQTDA